MNTIETIILSQILINLVFILWILNLDVSLKRKNEQIEKLIESTNKQARLNVTIIAWIESATNQPNMHPQLRFILDKVKTELWSM